MAHHKRGKPKSARAGCLLCKPHKKNGCAHRGERREADRLLKQDVEQHHG